MNEKKFLKEYYERLSNEGGVSGVNNHKKNDLIVTLTTIPSRIASVHLVIESLLRQNLKPDKIILWLDNESFKGFDTSIFNNQQERGLDVRYCNDYGSYKKLIPSLESFPDNILVTCDDDAFYPKNWLASLYTSFKKNPNTIQCCRGHIMTLNTDGGLKEYAQWIFDTKKYTDPSFQVFPTGVGGVLYFPGCFDDEVLNKEMFLENCKNTDDVWFKVMSLKKGIRSQITENIMMNKGAPLENIYTVPDTQEINLYNANVFGGGNDMNLKKIMNHYEMDSKINDLFNEDL